MTSRLQVRVSNKKNKIFINQKNRKIIISETHKAYVDDLKNYFNYYYGAIKTKNQTADFSVCKEHLVRGFKLFPICFPSIPEPLSTTKKILNFARLKKGDNVLDLGAYSGLSAISFKLKVGETGTCIAVEADPKNAIACRKNLLRFKQKTGLSIKFENKAIWGDSNGVGFTSEGAMGSTVSESLNRDGATFVKIPSISLDEIAKKYKLSKISFIKCDIEGSEDYIFKSRKFFKNYRPLIAVEYHNQHTNSYKYSLCEIFLKSEGYATERALDPGSAFPLILAKPSNKRKSVIWRAYYLWRYYKTNGREKEFFLNLLKN